MSALLCLNLGTSMFAGIIDGKVTLNFTNEDIKEIGEAFKDSMPALGKELKEAAPIYGKEARSALEAGAQKIIDNAPLLTQQVKQSCDEINRTAKIIANPLKTVPLSGVGLASTIAGFVLLYKSLDAYCSLEIENYDGTMSDLQKNERSAALKRGLSGLALIIAGLVTIIKSDAIVNQFA